MPFVANTPESLLGRSDSKDAGSTCRGITSNGRPCRRPIARSPSASLAPPARPVKPDLGGENLYCWQHKEQASRSAQSSPGPRRTVQPILEQRSSLDTLADRLGLIDLPQKTKEKRNGHSKANKANENAPHRPTKPIRPKPKQNMSFCFCFTVSRGEADESPRPRPKPRPLQQHAPSVAVPSAGNPHTHQRLSRPTASPSKNSHASKTSSTSQTAQFKNLIPDSLDAATASALMAELCRPLAEAEEAGYIYMFWLTPVSKQDVAAPVAAARSLLAPPSPRGGGHARRASDVVSRFADSGEAGARGTMLLKIGRAANVQRRMNQWQRQCGHDIEMLRYYPYMPGASDASATGQVPRMTPHCRRVERLVHVELSGLGLRASMATCVACGRDHREWFQVEASREAVRMVDAVIRRWVEWDETTI